MTPSPSVARVFCPIPENHHGSDDWIDGAIGHIRLELLARLRRKYGHVMSVDSVQSVVDEETGEEVPLKSVQGNRFIRLFIVSANEIKDADIIEEIKKIIVDHLDFMRRMK